MGVYVFRFLIISVYGTLADRLYFHTNTYFFREIFPYMVCNFVIIYKHFSIVMRHSIKFITIVPLVIKAPNLVCLSTIA